MGEAASIVIDTHVHIVNPSVINYSWFVPPTPPMACPCVFDSGLPCGCDWDYTAYAAASAALPAKRFVFVEVAAGETAKAGRAVYFGEGYED